MSKDIDHPTTVTDKKTLSDYIRNLIKKEEKK